jgi:hypothetical protein
MFLRMVGRLNSRRERKMYTQGFDLDAVIRRLKATFAVEQDLPFPIQLMLAHLQRAETQDGIFR